MGGYLERRKEMLDETSPMLEKVVEKLQPHESLSTDAFEYALKIGGFTPTDGNSVEVFNDTQEALDAILHSLSQAKKYALVQFYVVRDDETGRTLLKKLLELAENGIRVVFYYDPLESSIPNKQQDKLRKAGVRLAKHTPGRSGFDPLSGNFRNHRKLVVIDGRVALSGGMNIGDDYLSRVEELSPWNDIFLRYEGPCVLNFQLAFYRDFYFCTDERLSLSWTPRESNKGNAKVAVFASDPDEVWDVCGLAYAEAIGFAREQIILASPFFIPDEKGLFAIQSALLRGVKVKILRPNKTTVSSADHAAWYYIGELLPRGAEFYKQPEGAMHKKVLVIDDKMAMVGSANFDYRSFHLNHELFTWIDDESVVKSIRESLEKDVGKFQQLTKADLEERTFKQRVKTRACSLVAPVL